MSSGGPTPSDSYLLFGTQRELKERKFRTLEEVTDYFAPAFRTALGEPRLKPSFNGKDFECRFLGCAVPRGTKQNADIMRLNLPEHFPSQQRAARVAQLLKRGIHVFAPAVSGAGKTQLCFDIARTEGVPSFYFDFNGGHGKVQQADVQVFLKRCNALVGRASQLKLSYKEVGPAFEHLIGALFIARWITLWAARAELVYLPNDRWLWMQTDHPLQSRDCYNKCLELSQDSLETILNVFSDLSEYPLVLLDESQALLEHKEWFRSSAGKESKRPLGYAVIKWVADNMLTCLCCGTNLSLQDFAQFRSAAGGTELVEGSYTMCFNFDFLMPPQIKNLFNHILKVPGMDDALDDVIELLQGRPRFAAACIGDVLTILEGGRTGCITGKEIVKVIVKYTTRMISQDHGEKAIGALWKRLYKGDDFFLLERGKVKAFDYARDMLLQSLFRGEGGKDFHTSFPLDETKELVSRGISMIQEVNESQVEVMAEPLVLTAGMSFFAREPQIDIAADILKRFHDPLTDPQHRGRLLEILVAVRLFQKPDRLTSIANWPRDVQQPKHQPRGILMGCSLMDPRLKFSSLDTTPAHQEEYWIGLPETFAGPDLVYPVSVWSMKSSSHNRINSHEAKKSIKTTDPARFYTKSNGGEYDDKPSLLAKREATQLAVGDWKMRIVRVRLELPGSARENEPPNELSTNGKWNCKSGDVDNKSRGNDVMLYISEATALEVLDIPWKARGRTGEFLQSLPIVGVKRTGEFLENLPVVGGYVARVYKRFRRS